MFDSILSLQAKMFQTMTEMAVTNMNNSIKLANDLANATTLTPPSQSEKKSKRKAAPKKKDVSLPMPFNYFPNLYNTDQENAVFPFTPEKIAEAFQPKLPAVSGWPFSGNLPTSGMFPVPSMNPFSALNPMQNGFSQMMPMDTSDNLKGFMVFFEIPMNTMKAENMPWNQFAKFMQPNS